MSHGLYLINLQERIRQGLADWPAERRERHAAFLLSRQKADGGFAGRTLSPEGDPLEEEDLSDLYYTGFAVRALVALGAWSPETAVRVASYIKAWDPLAANAIDLLSGLYCAAVIQATTGDDVFSDRPADWVERRLHSLEAYRREDGGYAKSDEGASGSTYHSFLVALCYEFLGAALPDPARLVAFVLSRQRDDGGFVEIGPMKRSGTNPTAAAVALLQMFGGLTPTIAEDVESFLRESRGDEGGYLANTRIPFADSLSTFTALVTCDALGIASPIPPAKIARFLTALERPQGGFLAASWDKEADAEYTFYGLGGLGLLATRGDAPSA